MPKERRHLAQRSERASLEGVLTRPFDSPAGSFDFALIVQIRQSRTSTCATNYGLNVEYSPDSKGWSPHRRWILNHVVHSYIREVIHTAIESPWQELSFAALIVS